MASLLETVLIGCLVGFSLILLAVSLVSYRRTRNTRLLLVGLGFLIFFLKGFLLVLGLAQILNITEGLELLVLDLLILLFLYFAVAKG